MYFLNFHLYNTDTIDIQMLVSVCKTTWHHNVVDLSQYFYHLCNFRFHFIVLSTWYQHKKEQNHFVLLFTSKLHSSFPL